MNHFHIDASEQNLSLFIVGVECALTVGVGDQSARCHYVGVRELGLRIFADVCRRQICFIIFNFSQNDFYF